MADEKEPLVTITMTAGELIGTVWRETGDVIDVDKRSAERWVTHGSATYGGLATAAAAANELGDFPGATQFAAAGVTTLDGVKALIAEHGDAWAKQVKGITKPMAAAVSAKLEELAGK